MLQAVTSNILLYADDLCLVLQDKDLDIISKYLNEYSTSLCDFFIDSKLSINVVEDNIKWIFI